MDGFPAVAKENAQILILGSFPGAQSLAQREYYANPHNAFWRIMCNIMGSDNSLSYEDRLKKITENGFALWDVCASGEREGSLDSAIQTHTVIPNNLKMFLSTHHHIKLIAFNGAKAAQLFERMVIPTLPEGMKTIRRVILPSTSPAHAAMPFDQKLMRWQNSFTPILKMEGKTR